MASNNRREQTSSSVPTACFEATTIPEHPEEEERTLHAARHR